MEGGWMPVVFSPRKMRTSVPHTAFAPTPTRTSPGPILGVFTSFTSISFGPLNTAAIMRLLSLRSLWGLSLPLSCHVPHGLVHQLPHLGIGLHVLVHVELVLLVTGLVRLDGALGVDHVLRRLLDVGVDVRADRGQYRRTEGGGFLHPCEGDRQPANVGVHLHPKVTLGG